MDIRTVSNDELKDLLSEMREYFLFEFNDEESRNKFKEEIYKIIPESDDFIVVCDETNNLPHIIDCNMFIIDLFVRRWDFEKQEPMFIQINAAFTPHNSTFSENG